MTTLKETNKALITHPNKMEIYKVLYKEFRIILLSLANNKKNTMHEQNEKFDKKIASVKKKQTEILELNTITEDSIESFKSRFNMQKK